MRSGYLARAAVLVSLLTGAAAFSADSEPLRRLGSDRFRQAERVEAITYSPDGKQLATADRETIYIWNASDGRLMRTINGNENRKFVKLRFSADATGLVAVAVTEKKDAILYQLNLADGKQLAATDLMKAGKSAFNEPAISFSPDGRWVAARRGDGHDVAVMNTATRKVVWSDHQPDEQFHSLAFRGDSQVLAVGGFSGQVRLVDLKAACVTDRYAVGTSAIWRMAFAPDGKDLVAGIHSGSEEDVIRFDAATGTSRWTFRTESTSDLTFADEGKSVVYFGPKRKRDDPYLWHWLDAATGKPLGRVMDTEWSQMALRPDGKVMALGGFHGHISQWDLSTQKRLDAASTDPSEPVTELRFGTDGSTLRGWSRGLYEWDVKTGMQTRRHPKLETRDYSMMTVSDDQKWLGRIRANDLQFELIDCKTGRLQSVTTEHEQYLWFQFRADGRLVLRGPSALSIVDPVTGKETTRIHRILEKENLAVAETGLAAVILARAGNQFRGTRLDLTTGKPIGEWEGRLPDPSMMERSHRWREKLSQDGQVLAVLFNYLAHPGMGFDRIEELHTALFDARTGRYLSGWCDLHSQADLAFSPDGRSVACFYRSGLGVDIREVATGQQRMRRSNPPVSAAAFSPDGRTLALATSPGPVALWDLVGKPGDFVTEKSARYWDGLVSDDAEVAFDVICKLRSHPKEAVPFLKGRMKLPIAPTADWLAARIKALDSAQFRDREKATNELAELGELIVPDLRAALAKASPEVRERLTGLLGKGDAMTPDKLRAIRACEVLEGIGSPESRVVLAEWSKGPPAATLTREATESLARLKTR